MLGSFVYFCDMTERKVKQGYVLTRTISDSGYIVNIVMSNGIKKNIEDALIFDSNKDAEIALVRYLEVKDKMDFLVKKQTEELNKLRKQVIGEPEFKELANELIKK